MRLTATTQLNRWGIDMLTETEALALARAVITDGEHTPAPFHLSHMTDPYRGPVITCFSVETCGPSTYHQEKLHVAVYLFTGRVFANNREVQP